MKKTIVNRLVAQTMSANKKNATGCVPCFAAVNRKFRICMAGPGKTTPAQAKN
jgi:hypothetical protein